MFRKESYTYLWKSCIKMKSCFPNPSPTGCHPAQLIGDQKKNTIYSILKKWPRDENPNPTKNQLPGQCCMWSVRHRSSLPGMQLTPTCATMMSFGSRLVVFGQVCCELWCHRSSSACSTGGPHCPHDGTTPEGLQVHVMHLVELFHWFACTAFPI